MGIGPCRRQLFITIVFCYGKKLFLNVNNSTSEPDYWERGANLTLQHTCNWYSRTGISPSLVGPNCRLTAEYLTAIDTADAKFTADESMIAILPEDRMLRVAPKRSPIDYIKYLKETTVVKNVIPKTVKLE